MYEVFLSYSEANYEFVNDLAMRLYGDAHLTFWFAPWHSIPGKPIQKQTEEALKLSRSCAIFIGGGTGSLEGWQNREMREAIRKQVEENPNYRVIPVFLPEIAQTDRELLPAFLKHYFQPGLEIAFRSSDDEAAFNRLMAGILGLPPIQVKSYIQQETEKMKTRPPTAVFQQGHALVIGVANYVNINPLPETVLNDACDLEQLLTNPDACGYPTTNVIRLLDDEATNTGIRSALATLARRTGPDDTVVIYFSGHGAHNPNGNGDHQFLLPYDCNAADLAGTTIAGDEMTAMLQDIKAGRLLVLFDSCHSGGAGRYFRVWHGVAHAGGGAVVQAARLAHHCHYGQPRWPAGSAL